MEVICAKCKAKYNIPDEKIPEEGTSARCKKCGNILIIEKVKPPEPAPKPAKEKKIAPVVWGKTFASYLIDTLQSPREWLSITLILMLGAFFILIGSIFADNFMLGLYYFLIFAGVGLLLSMDEEAFGGRGKKILSTILYIALILFMRVMVGKLLLSPFYE